jgi:hypothetical protein
MVDAGPNIILGKDFNTSYAILLVKWRPLNMDPSLIEEDDDFLT